METWWSELAWSELAAWERSLLLFAGCIVVYLVFRLIILRGMERLARSTENDLDDRLVHFARRFFGLALLFVLIVGILKAYGVEVTPLLASAGIAGIALGLAAKETLADILAGVFLIADRPMRIGDRVKIEDIGRHWGGWGDVVDIGLRRTKIRNTDGVVVNYPNAVLANSVITNFSFEKDPVRVRVRFQVSYDVDIGKARYVATEAISSTPGVLPDTTEVVVRSLWDDTRGHLLSGVLMEGRYRIENVRHRTRIRSAVLENLLETLRREGIAMAAPALTLLSGSPEEE